MTSAIRSFRIKHERPDNATKTAGAPARTAGAALAVPASAAAVPAGASVLPSVFIKVEVEEPPEQVPRITAGPVGDSSESWWRDYMTTADVKPNITDTASAAGSSARSEVSLLRSFKRRRLLNESSTNLLTNTSTSSSSNTNNCTTSITNSTNTSKTTTSTVTTRQSTRNSNKAITNRNKSVVSNKKSKKTVKEEHCTVFVTRGIIKNEPETDHPEHTINTITNTTDSMDTTPRTNNNSGNCNSIISNVEVSNDRNDIAAANKKTTSSVRSLLRSIRIKEDPAAAAPAIKRELAGGPVKEEFSCCEEDSEEPLWLADVPCTGVEATLGGADEHMDTAGGGMAGSADEEEEEGEEMVPRTRSRRNIKNQTQKIKSSRLKSFRKEKPIRTRLKTGTLATTSSEFNPYSYTCPFCPFTTGYIVHMKRHRTRHISDGALNCKRCEFTTKSKDDYKQHLIKHYQADSDTDEEEEEEEDEEEYEEELEEDADMATFGGEVPEGSVSTQQHLSGGSVYHQPLPFIPGGPPTYDEAIIAAPETKLFEKILDLRCRYCPFFTTYRSIMNVHRSIHQAEGVMYCPQCDLSTLDKDEYKEHLMNHYAKDSFTCEYCGYTTISQYLYLNHTTKHTEKTYCCTDCDYTTGFKKAFKYHRLKHSAEKLLRCKHCPFITKYRHNYRQHMATHTGKGLMFCDYCSFYSAWETNFSRHLARHKMEEEARRLEEQARLEAEQSFATKLQPRLK